MSSLWLWICPSCSCRKYRRSMLPARYFNSATRTASVWLRTAFSIWEKRSASSRSFVNATSTSSKAFRATPPKVCYGLVLQCSGNPDLRSQRSPLIDRDEHSNRAVNQPRVEPEHGKQLVAQTPPSRLSEKFGSNASFAAFWARNADNTWCSAAAMSGRRSSSDEGSPGATGGRGGDLSPTAT